MSLVLKSAKIAPGLLAELGETIGLGHSLSQRVLEVLPGVRSARLAVPEDYDLSVLESLRYGGVCSMRQSHPLLAKLIKRYLGEAPGNAVLFEDYVARTDDEFLRSTEAPWVSHDDEVYYLLSASTASPTTIDQVLRRASDPVHTLGMFTKGVSGSSRTLTADDLERAVDQATSFIVGVFDGESFVQLAVGP